MKNFKIKRMFLQMAFLFMVTAGLFGCSRDGVVVSDPEHDSGKQEKKQAMGRYEESEIALPEGVTYDSVVSFQNGPNGQPILFTRKEKNGLANYSGYLLLEDLTWEERECGWLNKLELPYENNNINISYGENNKFYAVYSEIIDENLIPRHYVIVTEDWENCNYIQMPILTEKNELGYTYFPKRIAALENGNMLFESGRSIFLYDAAGQKKIAEMYSDDSFYFAHKNQFYILDADTKSLVLYDGEDGTEKNRYPLELDEYYGVFIIAEQNGDLSLLSKSGIQILKNGSGIWEQIIEGERNTMGSPKYYPAGFAKGGQEDYYVYYNSLDEVSKLSRYVYNPDMPVEPETELTIFSLYDNQTIRQAVSEFQVQNPNVKVDFQPFILQGAAAITEDYIRSLNTELLAGTGPDILILDGLSEASYIEKGILEDITDEVETFISSGDFLANIADGCRRDGRIYSVPVRIGIPMIFGRKEALKEAGQLTSLSGLVQDREIGQIFGTVDREQFLSLYADAFLHDIVSETGVIQEQELKDFLGNMKLILDGSKISDGTRDNRATSIWGLLESGTSLYSQEVKGFCDSGQGISIIEQAQGELEADFITINQTFIPYGSIGINQASKNKEIAIKFLGIALSEEVQQSDLYDGFAVNQNALESLKGIERNSVSGYGGSIDGTDGRTYDMKFGWPSEPLRHKLIEACKTVKYSAGRYLNEKQILLEYTNGYFDGTVSLEETIDEFLTKITLYHQE